jgi:aminopeptidase N
MKKLLFAPALFTFLLFSLNDIAQTSQTEKGAWYCHQKKIHGNPVNQDFLKSINAPRHSFNVIKYTLNVDLYHCYASPYPHSFTGSEIIRFAVDSTLNSITLDANTSSLTIDSVGISASSFTHSNNLLSITLDNTYNPGDTVEVKISYKHKNVSDNAFYTGNGFVYTDCEPEGARKWFPCWDKPSDKALTDITAKVPHTVLLGSNGRLQDSTHVVDTIWYHWISRDPVATYLTVITSKVNFHLSIFYWPMLSNPSILIPIRYYYNTGENISNSSNVIVDMTDYYSTLFCEHPFEKNGFTSLDNQFPWGGMENQTLTSFCQGCWDEGLTAHEFAHQWFGDMITCGRWSDVFLNEGFATFSEALWAEHTGGYSSYKNSIDGDAQYYLDNNPGWEIFNPAWAIHTPSLDTLFDYAITYCKGSCVLHMFRYVAGDTLFFHAIKEYASDTADFKLKSAVIPDFITKMNQACGQNYDWYFNEWLSQPNHPVYDNSYSFGDNGDGTWTAYFLTNQVQTNTGFFKMPLELHITFNDGTDTIATVMNDQNNQLFQLVFSKHPVSLIFDPDNEIVLKEATTIVGLADITDANGNISVFPNPAKSSVTITSSEKISKIEIADTKGKIIFSSTNICDNEISVDLSKQAKGVYFVKVCFDNKMKVKKLILY